MTARYKLFTGLLGGGLLLGGAWMVWQHRSLNTSDLRNQPAEPADIPAEPEGWERPADRARWLRARLPVERRSLEVVREALGQAREPFFPDRERVRQLEERERAIALQVQKHEKELSELGSEAP